VGALFLAVLRLLHDNDATTRMLAAAVLAEQVRFCRNRLSPTGDLGYRGARAEG
jgi:hypothetical protein